MVKVYGIKNCDTVRKALKWLESNQVDFQFVDYRKDPLDEDTLSLYAKTSLGAPLINTRSTSFRALDDDQKGRLKAASPDYNLLSENPNIIKRPIVETQDQVIIGFDESLYQQYLPA
ncbi:MAG: Spx/MgsR family RNA polymerase-binding regulatory protein [Pseudomonadota bacterium]|nr:Spx/MgsR family RNA polymerase-binding regulatory protein [Pseudomonadota bacterium]